MNIISKLSFRKKNTLSWALTFVLVAIGFGYAYLSLRSFSGTATDIVEVKMKILSGVKNLEIQMLSLRRNEKDFLLRHDEKYLSRFNDEFGLFQKELGQLRKLSSEIPKVQNNLTKVEEAAQSYNSGFKSVVDLQMKEGFKDKGLIGVMRNYAHNIEKLIEKGGLPDSYRVSLLTLRRHEKDFLLRRDMKYMDRFKKQANEMSDSVGRSGKYSSVKDEMDKNLNEYIVAMADVVKGSNDRDKAIDGFRQHIHAAEENIDAVEKEIAQLTALAVKEIKATEKKNMWMLEFISLSIALLILGVSFYINRVISFIDKTIGDLVSSNGEVNRAASTLSDSSDRLAAASDEQSATLQGTVSSLDEINAMVAENTKVSEDCKVQADASLEAARAGQNTVLRMKDSMGEIEGSNNIILKQVEDNNYEMKEVLRVIQAISEKIDVINDIVFQTKLLSFNASVEAARAGEQGKGFAVVAEEVGNLATMSGNAADEIFEIVNSSISRVESISKETASKMEQLTKMGKEKIEKGVIIAEECEESLILISESVGKVNQLMNQVAHASKEQSIGVNEISRAMNQFDEATQEVRGTSVETSTVAQQLHGQVIGLSDTVNGLRKVIYGVAESHSGGKVRSLSERQSPPHVAKKAA